MRHSILLAAGAALAVMPYVAQAEEGGAGDRADGAFALGQIIVTAPRADDVTIGGSSLSADAIYMFNRNMLDDAVNLMPGISSANSGGSRNERLIFVRGFDRFQVPLSLDGIRVYLPADNRLDYGRFLTPDIAEVQVAKGYASVLDGPGAMGGAINLVTRKPTKEIEAEARGTLTLDSDADYGGYNVFGLLGTKQDTWYAQGSYTRNVVDHWDLAGGYNPTSTSSERGGARDFSASRDWRVNAKIGFTSNATDEYAISYTRQEGAKNAPLHITDLPSTQRNWTWPYWNIESIYFLSTTALGDRATLKTRAYRNSFDNLLSAFDNASQTTQSLPRAFNSYYKDTAYGGSAQLDVNLSSADRFSLAAHYRRDKHVEYQDGFYRLTNSSPITAYSEPRQTTLEETYSIAAENRLALSPALALTVGGSFDWRDLKKAEEFTIPPARSFGYPLRDASAWNAQGRLEWSPDDATQLHASLSSRARFPTIFERFSTQFGTAASNPGLDPERATNYEIGGSRSMGALRLEGALFYSHVTDAIVAVRPAGFPANTTQRQNLGSADYYGAELSVSARLGSTLSLGANYTYTHRDFRIAPQTNETVVPVFRLTDVPSHKGFAYVDWSPLPAVHIVPNMDIASSRTTVAVTTPTPPTPFYYRTGSYVVANLRVDYALTDRIDVGVGARNLFDDYYILTDGFPEQGRSFFASLRARY
ncbi:MAG TPA: TonB-dependent receptor [Sphingobium sp.]